MCWHNDLITIVCKLLKEWLSETVISLNIWNLEDIFSGQNHLNKANNYNVCLETWTNKFHW